MHLFIRKTLAVVLAAMTFHANAQKYQVTVGEMAKDKVRPTEFIGADKNGNVYTAGVRNKLTMLVPLLVVNYISTDFQRYVKKYNSNLQFIENKRVMAGAETNTLGGKSSYFSFLFIAGSHLEIPDLRGFMVNDKYYLLGRGKKDNSNKYSLVEIDLSTGFMTKAYKALQLPQVDEDARISGFEMKFSPDSNNVMVLVSYKKGSGSKATVAYAAAVLSRDFNVLWSSNYSLPKVSGSFSYQDAIITNAGEILILGRNYNRKNKENPGYLSVFSISKENPKPKETRLNFGGDFVTHVYLTASAGNDPLIVGFYRNRRKKDAIDGIYYANLDAEKKIFNVRKKEFEQDFITSIYTKKEARKSNRKAKRKDDAVEESDFSFTDFCSDGNGGYVAVAEEYKLVIVQETSYTNRVGGGMTSTTRTRYLHMYGDMIVARFGSDGTITSLNKVAKSNTYEGVSQGTRMYGGQATEGTPAGRDYAMFLSNNNVYIMFNDNAGLEENKHDRKRDNTSNRVTYIASVSPSGVLDRQSAIAKRQMGAYTFDPARGLLKLADNKVAFLAFKGNGRGKKSIMGTITVN